MPHHITVCSICSRHVAPCCVEDAGRTWSATALSRSRAPFDSILWFPLSIFRRTASRKRFVSYNMPYYNGLYYVTMLHTILHITLSHILSYYIPKDAPRSAPRPPSVSHIITLCNTIVYHIMIYYSIRCYIYIYTLALLLLLLFLSLLVLLLLLLLLSAARGRLPGL